LRPEKADGAEGPRTDSGLEADPDPETIYRDLRKIFQTLGQRLFRLARPGWQEVSIDALIVEGTFQVILSQRDPSGDHSLVPTFEMYEDFADTFGLLRRTLERLEYPSWSSCSFWLTADGNVHFKTFDA